MSRSWTWLSASARYSRPRRTAKPTMLPEGSPLAVPVPPRTMVEAETSLMTSFPEYTTDTAPPSPARRKALG
jgi:hypothetical protein